MLRVDSKSPPTPGLPADVTVISIHPMYSAGQVTLATFLGGPLGGAWLIGLNYKRLGEPAKARTAIGLGVLAMAALIAIGLATGGMFTLVLAFIPILALNMLASSLQGDAYDRHVSAGGSRGSSWRAAGLGVASLAIYFAAIASVIEIRAAATRPDKVMLGESSVFYTDGVPRAEAQRVGEELVALKQLRTDAKWSVEVTRDGDRRVVAFVLKDSAFSKDEPRERFHRLAEPLSRDVYDGAPVDVWLIDAMLRPHVKLDWETRPREIDRNDRLRQRR
ncbi:MAG TPA: hypothetical protein VHT91_08040 [Kofleriaceae bacterium]|jgi:hypothetical protein|nr:hypothetical protein [Kofleriaceae bacterium]